MQLSEIKGVGPSVLKKLEKLKVETVRDLLFHFPSKYVDRTRNLKVFDLKFLKDDENYHCIAKVRNLKRIRLRGRRDFTTGTLEDETGYISAQWFNNPYIASQYDDGDDVIFSGKIFKSKVSNPKIKKITEDFDIQEFARIEPIYPETKGLKSYVINKYVFYAMKMIQSGISEQKEEATPRISGQESQKSKVKKFLRALGLSEDLPENILRKERLIPKLRALRIMHFPKNLEELDEARERLGFEEIYKILKAVEKRKKTVKKKPTYKVRVNDSSHQVLLNSLSFQLTQSQEKSISEIFTDLSKPEPMHRLLNGDVGSGKTIVAASAAWQVVNNGMQVIVLAPTGVLAKQHYDLFRTLFMFNNIPVHLVTSDSRKDVERLKKEALLDGDTNDIFIGTHALLYHLELFRKVGLLIIDEQHKFGVKQRELLVNFQRSTFKDHREGETVNELNTEYWTLNLEKVPHVLSMSATPIPRSLALTLFGDIDVSFLEKPIQRKKIVTKVINDTGLQEKMYEWIRKEVSGNKAQVYVVCPLIEESEKLDAKSAVQEFERLKELYPEFKIELLHGKIKQKEKDEILQRFKEEEFQILVSTSVIEVGIDNPNATIMVIESSERFGLAQLHQIRGRVGRSDKQSYCFLKTSAGDSSIRLDYFASTNDGFKVAEYDLHQRGPGEVYGEAQSGVPDLKIANILDLELIKRVKKHIH